MINGIFRCFINQVLHKTKFCIVNSVLKIKLKFLCMIYFLKIYAAYHFIKLFSRMQYFSNLYSNLF